MSRFALLYFRGQHSLSHISALDMSVACAPAPEHEVHHEVLTRVLELLFQSLHVGTSERFCFAPARIHVGLPTYSDNFRVCLLCEVTCTFPGKD